MIDQYVFDFVATKSGHLELYAGSYTPNIGWDECETGRDNPFRRRRAFFNFDTSSLPDDADVIAVSFRIRRRGDPLGDPETYRLKFSLGTFIGSALDGNVGEWDGGTHLLTVYAKPVDRDVEDLSDDGGDPCPLVNLTGDTDLKVWDDSTHGDGDGAWDTIFNKSTTERCLLNVMFQIPSSEVTGKGYASASGEIVADGTGEATGEGDAAASGFGIMDGESSVTGTGDASGDGVRTGLGVGSVTGVGSSSSDGDIVGDATGTVTGVGSTTASPWIITDVTATVTGVGSATASGGLDQDPMSLHVTSVSVGHTHTSTIAVGTAHSATISVDPEDTKILNPRRLT